MANSRGSAEKGGAVRLSIQYYGIDGNPVDADSTPSVQIKDPNGMIIIPETTDGVKQGDSVGLYYYEYYVSSEAMSGMWEDVWSAKVQRVDLEDNFNFLVVSTDCDNLGTIRLGEDVAFNFSPEEIDGINILLKYLKSRLRSDGKKPKRDQYGAFITDGYGEMVYEECNVFSDEILVTFLCQALSEFNMVPFFTSYSFADNVIYTTFSSLIVEGAYIVSLASQALIEKGRDFTITDGGISYQPPQLGDFLSSQYNNWLSGYRERLKFIKNNIRSGPVGFGTFTNLTSGSPAVNRLRHLRSRKII